MEFPKSMLDKCRKGDRKSQKAFYQFFAPTMYGVCLRYFPNPEIAKDILQDGFVKVFENLQYIRRNGSLEGWIKRIIVNTALDYHRRNDLTKNVNITEAHSVSSEATFDQNSDYSLLLSIVNSLPNQYRIVFNLYAIEGYSHASIAEHLGISESTSKSNYCRAKAILRERIAELEKSDHYAIL